MARDGDGEVSRRIFGTRFILFYFLRRPSPFFKPRLLLLLDSFSPFSSRVLFTFVFGIIIYNIHT